MMLEYLPREILLLIFDFLPPCDLISLNKCCKFFHHLVSTSRSIEQKLLVSNQISESFRKRTCKRIASVNKKIFISYNWQYGRYKLKSIIPLHGRYMPWLNISKKHVLISYGTVIQIHTRNGRNKIDKERNFKKLEGPEDIVKFSYKPNISGNYVVTGCRGGLVYVWNLKSALHTRVPQQDFSDVNAVDIGSNQMFATGSKSGRVNLTVFNQRKTEPFNENNIIYSFDVDDHVWSLKFSQNASKIAIGSARYNNNVSPLNIIDTDRCLITQQLGNDFVKGSGILDVHWFGSDAVLSGGYDTFIRKWDLRVGKCVQQWEDPYNSVIYCLDSDNAFTVLTGTQEHGRVSLWDLRQKMCVQVYFMKCCRNRSSPVYSLAFDSCQLYAATDRYLSLLDFTYCDMISRDYSSCLH